MTERCGVAFLGTVLCLEEIVWLHFVSLEFVDERDVLVYSDI